jgi:hypothetical protein
MDKIIAWFLGFAPDGVTVRIYIISQISVLLSYAVWVISYQQKKRVGVLVFATIAPLLSTVTYILLGAWAAFFANMVSIPRNIIMYLTNRKKTDAQKKVMMWDDYMILVVSLVLNMVFGIITIIDNPVSILCVASTVIFTVSICQKNVGTYRVLGVLQSILFIVYAFCVGSFVSFTLESFLVIGELAGVALYFNTRNKRNNTPAWIALPHRAK